MDMSDLESSLSGSMSMGAEVVYGTHEDTRMVMSDKVQSLAGSIYQEFERMIARYDEDVVKTLMPLLVNVLECLDLAYQQNQGQDVELELLKEDNEQLVTQYEREKSARKIAEQKLLEFEDAAEGERKELSSRQEALESIVRMLELKHKNSMEHASRLEEREGELKKEYAKLHERYTELFKTHVDYMERTKLLHSGQQLANERAEAGRLMSNRLNVTGRSSGPISFGFQSLENAETVDSVPSSPISSAHSSPSLHSELDRQKAPQVLRVEKAQVTDAVNLENKSVVTSPVSPPAANNNSGRRLTTTREQRTGNTLYEELSFQDGDGDDDTNDITGGWVHPGDYASSGMGKEVENLIMENNELLATKNALNVVKDDLIVKVDELTGEIDMLREEILSLSVSRNKLRERISELEEELKKVKEANEAKQEADEEADVPLAQRRRFTRMEMARVLLERNQYKEHFMELQEAVRWTQMIRASREPTLDKHQNRGIWKFFQNLFSGGDSSKVQRSMTVPQLKYQAASNSVTPGLKVASRIPDRGEVEMGSENYMMRKEMERKEQYRQVKAHVKKDNGRLHAYGWSLPGKVSSSPAGKGNSGLPVPVPVYCRPLAETTPNLLIWCAAGVNLMGGYTKDGGLMVGGSIFYSDEPKMPESKSETQVESLEKELSDCKEGALLETKLSSNVWIVTTAQQASLVTVIDANNPAELLNSFGVCSAHVLCIASVPGASPSDYIDTPIGIQAEVQEAKTERTPSPPPKGETAEITALPAKVTDSTEASKPLNPAKNARIQEDSEEAAVLGKVIFIEKDETAVNQKDKHKPPVDAPETKTDQPGERKVTFADDSGIIQDEEEKTENNSAQEATVDGDGAATESSNVNQEVMSSVLATMWLGDEDGNIYVHSSVANWAQRLHTVKLKDAVISIVHVNGRVVVAVANGQVVIFKRNKEGEWDLSQYHIVKIGLPHQSVRQLAVVGERVWCGYRNKVYVLEPRELKIVHTLEAHPRRESPVRQMAWLGEGVWVSIRYDSTLRLYHAHTYQHLQDVDIEPYVSKMLGTGKLGFSLVRITSLLISSNRLWIGTSNGVIISVPLNDGSSNQGAVLPRSSSLPNAGVKIPPPPGSYIPYCSMAHAQLSFHGHRDNVKFFVAVPGTGGVSAASTPSEAMAASATSVGSSSTKPTSMLVISGGEGYVDFRIGDEMEDSVITDTANFAEQKVNQGELSHLIVWQVSTS
ncbi:JNK-interacting protein 3 isoform X2 [Anthonomus grandis grandis]|uniref:JNK-interacting protein 3 isoform X2 n=1 Tax=Anthonomus grandis grandis TaxID=2921223 RepID=UPI0021663EB6|nr:JNK-interacting protein 3 isoform X2 [Anthonomus grandis grandis]